MSAPELLIDDVIGEGFWFVGVTAKHVNAWLSEHEKAKEIRVRVNSPGGDVFEGVAIMNALKRADARVIVEVEGLAASAASIIALAGDEVRVHKGAQVMIHEAWGGIGGDATAHEAFAAELRRINGDIADLYAARTGKGRDAMLELMADETWMTADEAVSMGFADSVIAPKRKPAAARNQARASAVLALYGKAPRMALDIPRNERADDTETNEMDEFLKALGFASMSALQDCVAFARSVEAAAGKQGGEALGFVRAALESHTELPKAQAKIADLEKTAQSHEIDKAFAKAKEENRLTPALEEKVRASFAAGDITLSGARTWLENSPVVAALAATKQPKVEQAPANVAGAPELTHNGKAWAQLNGAERAALKRELPETYNAMRDAAQKR